MATGTRDRPTRDRSELVSTRFLALRTMEKPAARSRKAQGPARTHSADAQDEPLRYVIEGKFRQDEYCMRVFHMPSGDEHSWPWSTFPLLDLDERGRFEGQVIYDEEFIPGPCSDVVPCAYGNE